MGLKKPGLRAEDIGLGAEEKGLNAFSPTSSARLLQPDVFSPGTNRGRLQDGFSIGDESIAIAQGKPALYAQ